MNSNFAALGSVHFRRLSANQNEKLLWPCFVMVMFLPHDVPQPTAYRCQMEAMLYHTTKPICYVTTDFSGCQDALAMAEAVAGGADALRRRFPTT